MRQGCDAIELDEGKGKNVYIVGDRRRGKGSGIIQGREWGNEERWKAIE